MASYGEFAQYYDRLMYDCDYEKWSQYLLELLNGRGISCGYGVDFACGSGRMTQAFAEAGFRMLGVDLSCEMLNEAVKRCVKLRDKIVFAQGNMVSFRSGKQADFVSAVCDGVNYLDSEKEFPHFAANCFRSLRKGGILLFDISSDDKLSRTLGNNLFGDDTADVTYLWQNELFPHYVDMNLIFFIKQGETYRKFTEQHRMYRYETERVLECLRKVGFSEVCAFGWLTEDPPKKDDQRIQFLAKK